MFISLLGDCEQVTFHFVENVLPRSSRISLGNRSERHGEEAE